MDRARKSIERAASFPDRGTAPGRKLRELRTLAAVGEAVSRSGCAEETYERIARAVWSVLPFDRFSIASLNERERLTDVFVLDRRLPQWRKGETYRLRGPLAAEVIEDGRIDQLLARLAGQVGDADEVTFPARFPSMLRVPIEFRGRSVGSLALRSEQPRAYRHRNLAFARQLAAKLGPTLEYFRVSAQSAGSDERSEAHRRAQPLVLQTVSERLHNSLVAARTAVRLIEEAPEISASRKRDRAFEVLNRSLDRLGLVAERLREYSLLAANDRPLTFQTVDLGGLLNRLFESRSDSRASRRQSAGLPGVDHQITGYGDPAMLERLFSELIENAHRHTADGGWIRADWRYEGAWLVVEIVNVSEAPGRRTGLGLCIADTVLKAHGGELRVEPGNGYFRVQTRLPSLETFRSLSRPSLETLPATGGRTNTRRNSAVTPTQFGAGSQSN